MMPLLLSASLLAANPAIEHISDKKIKPSAFRQRIGKIFYGQEDITDYQYEDILDRSTIAFMATLGGNTLLDFFTVLAHEYGHAIPSIVTGSRYGIEISASSDVFFPFAGTCLYETYSPFISTLLGPITGVSTTYLQCAIIKALRDSCLENKSFSECFKPALKFPITFFNNAIKKGKKYWAYAIEAKDQSHDAKEEILTSPEEIAINTVLFMRIMYLIMESIYGFLPYETSGEIKGDGEKIWNTLLGSQSPTFKVNLTATALAAMSVPYIIGAIKAQKKYTFDPLIKKAKDYIITSKNIVRFIAY